MAAVAATAAIVWSLLAFGAVYAWAALPLLALALAAAAAARAWPRPARLIDAAALAVLAGIALQLVPLPPSLVDIISPDVRAFHREMRLAADPGRWRPLSLDPTRTGTALMLAAAAVALLLTVRRLAAGDLRRVCRWTAWLALGAAALGLAGPALLPGGIYGFWTPLEPGAHPFGPIVNRNHFAAWAIAAAAITAGGLAVHAARRRRRVAPRRAIVAMLSDARGLWLLASLGLTTAAIVLTASRAGFLGLTAAAAVAAALGWRRAGSRALWVFAVLAIASGAAIAAWARPARLLARIEASSAVDLGMRHDIWTASIAMAGRYPIAGVGAGAYPAAMTHYQTPPREVFFNHAHNQYLEFAAEGGLLLGVPLVLLAFALVAAIARRLREDRTEFVWLRIGGAAALAGLALLSLWESPFRTPATLVIAALAAGIATSGDRR